jgi:hypothetical protein
MGLDGPALPVGRTRVVGGTVGSVPDRLAQVVQELVGLRPALGQDHDLGGDAVEAGVVEPLGSHVLGLQPQSGIRPLARNHDYRADATKLTGDGLVEQGLAGVLS